MSEETKPIELLRRTLTSGLMSEGNARYLIDHIQQLEAVLKEADEYLDINELTSIGHGSILHRKFKELLKEKGQ